MTPRIIGLLSFYDEPAATLHECIEALASVGVDHIVAVDGAYAMFPDAKPCSPPDQQAAVIVACRKAGLAASLHVPAGAWAGNEVEKRTFMFALGLAHAREGDWFWVQDADQVVIKAPKLKQRLAATDRDVAAVTLRDMVAVRANRDDWPPDFLMRSLFRAQPIAVVTNHYTYVTRDGRVLWGGHGHTSGLEPALEMPDVLVEHRPDRRPLERLQAKHRYYTERDETGVELGDCMRCDEPTPAVRKVAADLRVALFGGQRRAVGTWIECCDRHARRTEYENRWWLRENGFDADRGSFDRDTGQFRASGMFQNRNGNLPRKAAA